MNEDIDCCAPPPPKVRRIIETEIAKIWIEADTEKQIEIIAAAIEGAVVNSKLTP